MYWFAKVNRVPRPGFSSPQERSRILRISRDPAVLRPIVQLGYMLKKQLPQWPSLTFGYATTWEWSEAPMMGDVFFENYLDFDLVDCHNHSVEGTRGPRLTTGVQLLPGRKQITAAINLNVSGDDISIASTTGKEQPVSELSVRLLYFDATYALDIPFEVLEKAVQGNLVQYHSVNGIILEK